MEYPLSSGTIDSEPEHEILFFFTEYDGDMYLRVQKPGTMMRLDRISVG